jgi:hypothetical protein
MALSRKRRPRRAPRGWSEGLEDLHDYMRVPPQRAASPARAIKDSGPIVVTDDWPERIPIGDAELRAIEGHLRKELDDLFGPLP